MKLRLTMIATLAALVGACEPPPPHPKVPVAPSAYQPPGPKADTSAGAVPAVTEPQPDPAPVSEPSVSLVSEPTCINPCTFSAIVAGGVIAVQYEADAWALGTSTQSDAGFELTYDFSTLGVRQITAIGLGTAGEVLAADTRMIAVESAADPPACSGYHGQTTEYAPIQLAASGTPPGAASLQWTVPCASTSVGAFAGTPGSPAVHEGVDHVHDDASAAVVPVLAAATGSVAYVRTGCPQSSTFGSNAALRECGSGWGNHVVIEHVSGVFTRYAHLAPDGVQVEVGEEVAGGQPIAEMGNSGRSDVRHLHFELGTSAGLDPCATAQSFDAVYDPALLAW